MYTFETDGGPWASLMEKERQALYEDGYAVFENWVRPRFLELLRGRVEELFVEKGDRAGWEFKTEPQCRHLANLVNKGEIFIRAISHPFIAKSCSPVKRARWW